MVDRVIVEYVARLAHLAISQAEKEYLAGQLSKILDYIDKLKELDTDGVEPLRSLVDQRNVFRVDQAKPSGKQAQILHNAPSLVDGHFKIPKVIE